MGNKKRQLLVVLTDNPKNNRNFFSMDAAKKYAKKKRGKVIKSNFI